MVAPPCEDGRLAARFTAPADGATPSGQHREIADLRLRNDSYLPCRIDRIHLVAVTGSARRNLADRELSTPLLVGPGSEVRVSVSWLPPVGHAERGDIVVDTGLGVFVVPPSGARLPAAARDVQIQI